MNRKKCFGNRSTELTDLKRGKENTTFFHYSTIQHKLSNRIIRLKTEDDTILEEPADLEREILRFNRNMLTEPNVSKYEAI